MELPELHWIPYITATPTSEAHQPTELIWTADDPDFVATYTFTHNTGINKLEVLPKMPMTRQSSIEGVREEMKPNTFKPTVLHEWQCDPKTDIATRLKTIDREAMSAMNYIKGLDTQPDAQ